MSFCRSDQFKSLYKCVETFELIRTTKGHQSNIQKHDLQPKKLWFMFVNCSYIVSFVVKPPSGGKNSWKTAFANPRMSLFEKCSKSWFDTVRWWGMSCAFDFFRNYWFMCFLRRVIAIFRQQKNFGPNVIYFVLGTLLIVARLT